jgi:hypothetical protein
MGFVKTGLGSSLGVVEIPKQQPKQAEKPPVVAKPEPVKSASPKAQK